MKKGYLFSMLLAAMLLLCLAACGGEAPAPGPAEEPGSTEEAGALSAPYYLTFAPGETAEQDVDGDGQAEEICLWLEDSGDYGADVHLSVNGEDLSEALLDTRGFFDCPDDQCWLLTDLDTGDGLLEIAVQDWGPRNDLTTSFFRYEDGTLRFLGLTEGFVCWNGAPADVSFDGQGAAQSYLRFSVLQTWWGKAASALDENGDLVLLPQEYYEATLPCEDFQSDVTIPQRVTVRGDLYCYDTPGGQQDLLPAGTELELLGTDDAEWVCARLAGDEQELWLHLDPEFPFQVEGPDGFVEDWEALDGLCMAD